MLICPGLFYFLKSYFIQSNFSVNMEMSNSSAPAGAGEFAQEFDYVAVFKMEKGKQSPVAQHFCQSLIKGKFEIFSYMSKQEDELIVLINATEGVLKKFADKVDYELLLEASVVQKSMEKGDSAKKIAPVKIKKLDEVSPIDPYQFIYGKFDCDLPEDLYCKNGNDGELFGDATKLKLIFAKIEAPTRLGGCALAIDKLLKHGANNDGGLVAFYPLHDAEAVEKLKANMNGIFTFPWGLPFNDLKKYFGEKIALYYCFLGHYSFSLLFPAIAGLVVQFIVWGTGDVSSPILPFFAVFVCLWSIVMLETWKREEKRIAMRWGMSDFEQTELDRPEFNGVLINSYIDGSELKYYPEMTRSTKVAFSLVIISLMIAMVVGTVTGIYIMRFSLQVGKTAPMASTAASVCNTIQITIFNMIYSTLSVKLTDFENHRTDTDYEDSMITKLFAFQFINSYASFFFLAFVASNLARADGAPEDYVGQCGATTCMAPLALNLGIIFGSRITVTNLINILIPYNTYKSNRKKETEGIVGELTRPEEDYLLTPAAVGDSLNNYADTAIQYGFMTLFITALPIACLFALFTNMLKVKLMAFQAFDLTKRPVPKGAQDIGSWQGIFELISTFAVITNGAVICFTMDVLSDYYSLFGRSWLFIGFQWGLMTIQYIIGAVIPDEPLEVQVQASRKSFICSKIIDGTPDEDYDEAPNGHPQLDGASTDDKVASDKYLKRLMKKGGADMPDIVVGKYPDSGGAWPKVETHKGPKSLNAPDDNRH